MTLTIPTPDQLLTALQLLLIILTARTLYNAYKSPYPGIPTVAYSRYLPNSINRLIYFVKGHSLVYHGYEKASLPSKPIVTYGEANNNSIKTAHSVSSRQKGT